SYIVARDFGFAPNPFFDWCTLATCKPVIRRTARVGDWILGTGSADKKRSGQAIYAMRVDEAMPFDDYWADQRFVRKRPDLRASRKIAFGDNIYRHDAAGNWRQLDSHHSFHDGSPNPLNVNADTATDRVLLSQHFVYWGGDGPAIPERLRTFGEASEDICSTNRGHKCQFDPALVAAAVEWFESFPHRGLQGRPGDW